MTATRNGRALAELNTPLETAPVLLEMGLWPVVIYARGETPGRGKTEPKKGKEPITPKWGLDRWQWDKLRELLQVNPKRGIGICLGHGRGPGGAWIIDVEGDGPEASASLAILFGGEVVESLGWSSTRGGHLILIVDGDRLAPILARFKGCERKDQPGVYKFPNLPDLEFRFGGYKADGTVKQLQSVVPPTPGTDGQPRRWNDVETIAAAPEAFYRSLELIASYADDLAVNQNTAKAAPGKGSDRFRVTATNAKPVERYVEVALADECGIVAGTGEGSRNIQLNLSAFKVGRLVAVAGGKDAAVAALVDAAVHSGLSEAEATRTVHGGITAGLAYPRDLSHVGRRSGKPLGNGRHHANGHHANGNGQHQANGNGNGNESPEAMAALMAMADEAEQEHAEREKAAQALADRAVQSLKEKGPAFYSDRPLFAELAKHAVDDPGGLAMIKAALKACDGFLPREFDRIIKFAIEKAAAASKSPDESPHQLARRYLDIHHAYPDGLGFRFWRDGYHEWDGAAFRELPDSEVRGSVANFLEDEGPEPDVTTGQVSNVIQALSGLTMLKVREVPEQPAWLGGDGPWPAGEVLPTKNALVHLPSLVARKPCTRPPTPLFFGSYALDYNFDPRAPEPTEWLTYLGTRPVRDGRVKHQLWPNDTQSIDTFQEWCGYSLVADTSLQKILALIGPLRSGKGTLLRVLAALVGAANVVSPRLSMLATSFGLAPLIGKPLAILADARLSGRSDQAAIVETLLSISGEDLQTIDRKHRDAWTGKLPTRFVLAANELPKLRDSSGALAGRLIVLALTESFYGREDHGLTDVLLGELPGILVWAIAGWQRLKERGKFEQPESGKALLEAMEDLSSPIKAFVRERCLIKPGLSVPITTLFDAWREWCLQQNRDHVGEKVTFGRDLHAAVPGLKVSQPRQEGDPKSRPRIYEGIGLIPDPIPEGVQKPADANPELVEWLRIRLNAGMTGVRDAVKAAATAGLLPQRNGEGGLVASKNGNDVAPNPLWMAADALGLTMETTPDGKRWVSNIDPNAPF